MLLIILANEFFVNEQPRPQLVFLVCVAVGAHNGIMVFYFQPRIEVTLDLSDIFLSMLFQITFSFIPLIHLQKTISHN